MFEQYMFEFHRITPKAFANFSPVLERSDNPGIRTLSRHRTLKGFANRQALSGFSRD
jgi:hypothetical protein